MDFWSELAVEHQYTQVLTVVKATGDELADIQNYVNGAVNHMGTVFYKAHLYKQEANDACRYTIQFFLFSSDSLYWNQTVQDKVKRQYLKKLTDKHSNIKLSFEDTSELVHAETKNITDTGDPDDRGFGNISGGNIAHKFFNWWLIVPRTQWAFFDLPFQLYMFDIFHQCYLTKLVHYFTIPLNAIMSFSFLAQFEFGLKIGHAAFSVNGALILFLLLCLIYILAGIIRKARAWAATSVFVMFSCWMVGNLWYHTYKTPGNPWYNPTTIPTNPLLWSYISGLAQAISHTFEPQVPPYYTGKSHWETYQAFFFCERVNGKNKCRHFFFMAFAVICAPVFPTLVAWMSWIHLIGAEVISIMVRIGYQPEAFEKYYRVLEKARLSGNPTIDFFPRKPEDLLHDGKPYVDQLRKASLVSENAKSSEIMKSLSTLKICDHFYGQSSEKQTATERPNDTENNEHSFSMYI